MAERARLRRAFTLVELLVVIAIIAILAGILLPALAGAKKSAYSIECKSHMRQIGLWGQLYVCDWNGVIPHNGNSPTNTFYWVSSTSWVQKYYECYPLKKTYADARDVLMCPQGVNSIAPMRNVSNCCYALSNHVGGTSDDNEICLDASKVLTSRKAWFLESRFWTDVGYTKVWQGENNVNQGTAPYSCWMWQIGYPWSGRGHSGNTANLLYGDGHVSPLTFEYLYQVSTGAASSRIAFWGH